MKTDKKNYFESFMVYCLARLNLNQNLISDEKKNNIIIYLKYMKANGAKANLKEVERIIKNESV
jgi:hypothetical protein